MRSLLIGFEQEPVVVFSIALSALGTLFLVARAWKPENTVSLPFTLFSFFFFSFFFSFFFFFFFFLLFSLLTSFA